MEEKALIPENINLNTESVQECLKTVNNWGETIHQNVCNGASATVPWGGMDYFLAIGIIAFVVIFVLMLAVAVFKMAFDY